MNRQQQVNKRNTLLQSLHSLVHVSEQVLTNMVPEPSTTHNEIGNLGLNFYAHRPDHLVLIEVIRSIFLCRYTSLVGIFVMFSAVLWHDALKRKYKSSFDQLPTVTREIDHISLFTT